MSLFAISDLHITGPEDDLYGSLLALFQQKALPGDTVVLAGDLFDFLVGNKSELNQKYSKFRDVLAEAGRRGVLIHYIEGNHDFFLEPAFRGLPGLKVYTREVSLEIDGKRFYFSHGDLANRQDYGYRFLRAFFRSPLVRAFICCAPGSWVEKIGDWSSRRSRQRQPILPKSLPAQRLEDLRKVYRNYAAERIAEGYDFVVMGHCHDLDEMVFNVGGRIGQYVNVGFPRVHGSYLSWSSGDAKIQREKLPSGA